VQILGQPLGGSDGLRALAGRDVRVAEDPDQVPGGTTVAFPPQGVEPGLRVAAALSDLTVIDGTCPLVALAHEDASGYAGRGDTVVLIGDPASAAAPVLAAQVPGAAVIVSDAAQVKSLEVADPTRVSFVVVPGMLSDRVRTVVAALRRRYPLLRGHHYDSWCPAADDRAAAVGMVAAGSDLTLILGRADDPDAVAVARMARRAGSVTRIIDSVTQIQPGWLHGVDAIGVATARSAAPGLPEQVTTVLSGLGPLSVITRAASTAVKSREKVTVG
jgi:4-hydroxy-3-methylbut-2-enyl diphosphate reductase